MIYLLLREEPTLLIFFNIVHPELPDLTSYNNSRIKQMVTENGAVFIASCFSPQYVDINSGATFCPGDSANHALL